MEDKDLGGREESFGDRLEEITKKLEPIMYETYILEIAKEKPKKVSSWIRAGNMSEDARMKNYYMGEMVKCISQKGDVISYVKGIRHAYHAGRKDISRGLAEDMAEKCPVAGKVYQMALNLRFHSQAE